jgi:GNAT superfamily N-acetyltransferase
MFELNILNFDFKEIEKVYNFCNFINEEYKNYKDWFFYTHVPELNQFRTTLYITYNGEIVAVSNLKKKNEKKICTFYVAEEFRNMGIGTYLMEESLKWLETKKPLITISEKKLKMFKYFIDKYEWDLKIVLNNYYKENSKEYCYNGILQKKKTTL